jgi:predicted lipid-binding transport protein (Tim44 family)
MQGAPDVLSGLGGMAGNMIGGTINGAAQGAGGLFTGLSSMLGMGSSNLTAPASTTAPLEATPPQPKPAQEPTGAISPSDSNSGNEIMVSLMNTQIDQLSSLNSMTRKLNSTAEQILKSQR